ncbi:MAG: hypothetical protein VYE22_40830 [Myxococcota bacterium]|nr:hypothetical protein [Myxococcota bacterium]
MRRHALLGWVLTCALLAPAVASAQATEERPRARHVQPPPPPQDRNPELLVGVSLSAVFPLEKTDICPGDSLCVLGAGAAAGVEIERRWPFGLGVLVAYDAWFVDSGGVFELGVVQAVRAAIRYVFAYEHQWHPSVHIGAGALVFGDTGLVSTLGGALEAGVGLEYELTESVSLDAGLSGWLFTTSPFVTGRDRTRRSEGLGLNFAMQLHVGLVIVASAGE